MKQAPPKKSAKKAAPAKAASKRVPARKAAPPKKVTPPPKRKPVPTPAPPQETVELQRIDGMNPRMIAFVDEYLIDMNATAAYKRAGYTAQGNSAEVNGNRLLRNTQVQAAIARRMDERAAKVGVTAEMVLARLWSMATADPNDLVQYRRDCCRHCWGINHAYQWDEDSYRQACDRAARDEKAAPDLTGGFGWRSTRRPHPECPNCDGEGFGYVHVVDTRDVTSDARLIYAGVKQTKEGLEVKMHDQAAALLQVAKHLGMFIERVETTDKTIEQMLAALYEKNNIAPGGQIREVKHGG